jgi:hypothetical protein
MFTDALNRYRDFLVVGQILLFRGERSKKGSFQILQVSQMGQDED